MTHPASINKLPHVAYVDALGTQSSTITIPATPPYTWVLGYNAAPANYPAGYQIVPPTTPGAVSVTGGGYGSWAQVTGSPAGGQFTVDDTESPTGGTITFSATDAGKSVTVNWIGSILPNEQWLEDIWNALHDIVSAEKVANGFAMLDSLGNLAGPDAAFVRVLGLKPNVATTPTPSPSTALGTSGAASLQAGNDMAGIISATAGASGMTTGVVTTVEFGGALSSAPLYVAVFAVQNVGDPTNSGTLQLYAYNWTTTGFYIGCNVAPQASKTYRIGYLAIR